MSEQDEYTPSVGEVQDGLIAGQIALARVRVDDPDTITIKSECGKQFDRMIAKVRADAWDEGFTACDNWDAASMSTVPNNPFRSAS